MLFKFDKNNETSWNVTPMGGRMAGTCIGTAEGLSLTQTQFTENGIFGSIQAVWGLMLDRDGLNLDTETIKSLGINKVFKMAGEMSVSHTREGYYSEATGRLVKTAKQAVLFGSGIFVKLH